MVAVVKGCRSCARAKAGFGESEKELQPLPVRGLGYRWGVDFLGSLKITSARNTWVMVCIEYFTKWVELILLPSRASKNSVWGLLEWVLSRYETPKGVDRPMARVYGRIQVLGAMRNHASAGFKGSSLARRAVRADGASHEARAM